MDKEKGQIDEVKLEDGKVSFVTKQKYLMRPDELKIRYRSLVKTLMALSEEKQKVEKIAKILKIKLD